MITGNRCGPIQTGPGHAVSRHLYGIDIQGGAEYMVANNMLTGNQIGGVREDTKGPNSLVVNNVG